MWLIFGLGGLMEITMLGTSLMQKAKKAKLLCRYGLQWKL